MALIKPCPRCQNPLEILQPPLDQVRCGKCGAVIKNKVRPSEKQEAPAASPAMVPIPTAEPALSSPIAAPSATPPSATSRRGLFILGLLGGLLLICVLPVAGLGLAWYFSGEMNQPVKEDPPVSPIVKPGKPEPPPPMPPKIRAAIDKGAAHLKKQVLAGTAPQPLDGTAGVPYMGAPGAETGTFALAGLALLEAGASPQEPAVQKALDDVRKNGRRVTLIYSLGTILFFLNRMDQANALTEDDRRLQHALTLQLVGGQCQDGRWGYVNLPLSPVQEQNLLQTLEAKTYKPTTLPTGRGASNSMTQFGLLALWGSRKRVPVRQPILHTAASFHTTQSPTGTWNYARPDMPGDFFRDSNTCAGLLALAMEKALREDQGFREAAATTDPAANPKADQQCNQAFAHLGKVIGRKKDDQPATHPAVGPYVGTVFRADAAGDYYFLWCLERVAVIYDLKEIGGKDWYGWGSEVILQNQKENGSWVDRHGDVADTCFAILFLTRANLAKDLTESIRTRGGKAAIP